MVGNNIARCDPIFLLIAGRSMPIIETWCGGDLDRQFKLGIVRLAGGRVSMLSRSSERSLGGG